MKRFLFLMIPFVFACERSFDDESFLGEQYQSVPDGFQIEEELQINSTSDSVDFDNEFIVSFKAKFSHEVSWELVVIGDSSKAKYKFSGLSNELNEFNAPWDGASTGVFFRSGETATATLEFIGSDQVLTTSVFIKQSKVYRNETSNGITLTILDDFEGNTYTGNASSTHFDGNDDSNEFFVSSTNAAQGEHSMHLGGVDASGNAYIGGVFTNPLNGLDGVIIEEDPKDVYVNLFIFGTGNPNSSVQLRALEIDDKTTYDAFIQNGGFDYEYAHDTWEYTIEVNWEGWKLVSIKYADMIESWTNSPAINNHTREPSKLVALYVNLLSLPQQNQAETYVDFVNVTQGGSFQP